MSDQFDPYYVWLGIQPKDQPPNHYRLLGIEVFEDNEQVIDVAANRQTTYLHEMASGPNAKHSQQLLNEIAAARTCLLDAVRKSRYDEELRQQSAPPEPDVEFEATPEPEPEAKSEPETETPVEAEQAASNEEADEATPSVIPLTCESCGAFYEVGLEDAGTLAECVCGSVMTVPMADGTIPQTVDSAGSAEAQTSVADESSAVAVATPPVAVADEPSVTAPEKKSGTRKRKSVQKKTRTEAAEKEEDESPVARTKKKSGWGMTAFVGVGMIAVAIALFNVLTADPSSEEDEPKPPPRQEQPPAEFQPEGDSNPDEPEDSDDGGSTGTFGPIRLDG